jgi:hypothetical protein
MIFQKHNSSQPTKIQFHIGDKKIDTTKEYNFLGLKISQNRKFKLAQQQLGEKALHALYKIRKDIDFHKLTLKLAMKIFDSIIPPYYCTTRKFGVLTKKNDYNKWENSEIEKVHASKILQVIFGCKQKSNKCGLQGRTW